MTILPTRRIHLATSTLVLAGLLVACGGNGTTDDEPAGDGTNGDTEQELAPVVVGALPIVDVVPLYMGVEAGIFEDHGLDVTIQFGQGGAAIIPAIIAGEFDFGYSNVVSILVAHENGLPLQVVSNGSTSSNNPGTDTTEVAAMPDSGITDVLDLQGRTVAINALDNFGDITIRNSIEATGGDPDSVEFVEVPYPNMPAHVDAGDVDAAWTTEPFRTQILQAGGVIVASPMTDMAENFDSAYYFSSLEVIEQDPEVVDAFAAGLAESFELAMSDDAATREAIIAFNELEPGVAEEIALPQWFAEVNREGVETLAAAAIEHGVLTREPDYAALLGE